MTHIMNNNASNLGDLTINIAKEIFKIARRTRFEELFKIYHEDKKRDIS